MTTATMLEYVTRGEFDLRMKRLEETTSLRQGFADERIIALEKMIDAKIDRLEAIVAKSISENREAIGELRIEMKSEMGEVRGNMKAFDARLTALETKFGWYLTLFGVGITIAFGVLQLFMK